MKAPHIRPLTGLRGVAAWWVCFHHYREVLPAGGLLGHFVQMATTYGYLAVDLFFILSGFVIHLSYGNLLRELRWGAVRSFAVARFARIYPLYIVVTLLFLANPVAILVFSHSAELGPRYDPGYFLLSLVLAQNWGWTREIAWNGAAWSISTEFVAYLAFPFASVAIARFLGRRLPILAVLAMLLLATAAFFYAASAETLGSDIAHLGLGRCLLLFFAGTLLSKLYQVGGPPSRALQAALLAAAAVGVATLIATDIPDYDILPAAFAALIFALTRSQGWPDALLGGRFLLFLGEISYAVYLVHSLVKDWINFTLIRPGIPDWVPGLVYVALVALAATALHRLVELPARRVVFRWAARQADRTGSVAAI